MSATYTVLSNGRVIYCGPEESHAHDAHVGAAMRRQYTEKWRDGVLLSYSGTKPKGYVDQRCKADRSAAR